MSRIVWSTRVDDNEDDDGDRPQRRATLSEEKMMRTVRWPQSVAA